MKAWLKAESKEDVAEFYNRKYLAAGREAFHGGRYSFFFKKYIELFGRSRPTDRLLDCGCGHGEFFERVLAEFKFSSPHMTGIDISEEALKIAADKFKNYEYDFQFIKFSMDDLNRWEMISIFDVVTCWGSIEHSFDPLHAFQGMLSLVKAGGIVMLTVPLEFESCLKGIEGEPFNKNNERFMTYSEWVDFFSQVKKPIYTESVDFPDQGDLFMVFRQ